MANANIGALALNPLNLITPLINGGTLGASLGVASTQVATANPQIQKITFANPSDVTIYVCQATDMNGNALTAGKLPGNWPVFSGGVLTFTGNGVAGAWLAAAASGVSNPLTIALSQMP